jgi:succinate dehydrogenase/fumarate reductase cytochrome b subunit
MSKLTGLMGVAILLLPIMVFAAGAPNTFQDLANQVAGILNSAASVLVVAGIVVYFYGVSTNILKFGEGDREKLKNYFVWGIIVLFVMVSIWGILSLLQNTLFGNSTSGNTTTTQQKGSNNQFQQPQFLE